VNEPSAPREASATGIYVYGVVGPDTTPTLFADARGVDAAQPVVLVAGDGIVAVTSSVPFPEFGQHALEANLQDPLWLEEKIRAHDGVLAAAIGRTTIVPFRFGAIYESDDHVREMLAERRDLVDALTRLAGKVELGVNGYFDRNRLRERVAAERAPADGEESSGRAYMQRRQLERELDTAVGELAAECSDAVHERLAAAADDARVNPLRPSSGDATREMLLNGAYLVAAGAEDPFRAALDELRARYAGDEVVLEVTGPWPPYNFAEATES
jgi:Gas vesicle synthesis protein GvpL/GvpF